MTPAPDAAARATLFTEARRQNGWTAEPVHRTDYRNAMARLGAAVNIITTDGPSGRAGFTASAVCSVTDEPPTLLVCLNRSASVYDAFNANGVPAQIPKRESPIRLTNGFMRSA